ALDNDAAQNLPAGVEVTDSVTVTSADATSSEVIIVTITGTNDDAARAATRKGSDTEDSENSRTGGKLPVTDVDTGEAVFAPVAPNALTGQYGTFTFDAASGAWTYTLDNDAAQHLAAGVEVTDTLTVTSADGTSTEAIVVTITGTNDAAAISGTATGSVTEDGENSTTGGKLTVTDVDTGEAVFKAVDTDALTGQYGTFTFDAATGAWTYELDNTKAQHLAAGAQATDT